MAPRRKVTQPAPIRQGLALSLKPLSQEEFTAMLTTEVREAVRLALATVLEEEVTALLGALPFERSPLR
jgi:hypothetical protein